MESTPKRVGSRLRKRTGVRKSLAETPSPPPVPKSSQNKRKREEASDDFYSIKEILDEKKQAGATLYLIDWEDNPETGSPYPPSWEPFKFVTEAAIAEWEEQKEKREARDNQARQTKQGRGRPPLKKIRQPCSSPSEPLRPSKKQKLVLQTSQSSASLGSPKKQLRAGTAETARFQSVSQDSAQISQELPEIRDTFRASKVKSDESGQIRVEVRPPENFDPTAYTTASVSSSAVNTQSSQIAPAESQLLTQISQGASSSWYAESEVVPVIEDSQDFLDSASYEPDTTTTVHTQISIPSNTQATVASDIADSHISSTQSSRLAPVQTQLSSSSHLARSTSPRTYRFGEHSSYHSRAVSSGEQAEISPSVSKEISYDFASPHRIPVTRASLRDLRSLSTDLESYTQPEAAISGAQSLTIYSGAREQPVDSQTLDSATPRTPEDSTSGHWQAAQRVSPLHSVASFVDSESTSPHVPRGSASPPATLSEDPHGPTRVASTTLIQSIESLEGSSVRAPGLANSQTLLSAVDLDMADQPKSGRLDIKPLLKNARAEGHAKYLAKQAAERALSIPLPAPSVPEMESQMLPSREPAVVVNGSVPDAAENFPPTSLSGDEQASKGRQTRPLGSLEYIVPLPMDAVTRDIYDKELKRRKEPIYSFLRDDPPSSRVVEEVEDLIERLKLLCNHQDLIVPDSASQDELSKEIVAKWAETVSTKCMFLVAFLDSLIIAKAIGISKPIAIVVQSGKMLHILEILFEYHHLRFGNAALKSQNFEIDHTITIIPSDYIQSSDSPRLSFSMVIAFDSTFQPSAYGIDFNVTRLVHLVVSHSAEHLEFCIDRRLEPLDRTTAIINGVQLLREEMGKLDSNYHPPHSAASLIAEYLINNDLSWPLLPMPDIDGVELGDEGLSQFLKGAEALHSSSTQTHNTSLSQNIEHGLKRASDSADTMDSSKRQRLTPTPGQILLQSSSTEASQSDRDGQSATLAAETVENVVSNRNPGESQQLQLSSLLSQINSYEAQVQSQQATESELREIARNLQSACDDYEQSISIIQPKYQAALNERGSAQQEAAQAVEREKNLQQRYEARAAELDKIRSEKALLETELAAARNTLTTSAVPEIAEFTTLRADLATARLENEKLQKKLSNMQSDLEYMRSNYQSASNLAAEARGESSDLKAENAVLQRKASENSVRIHEIQKGTEIAQHLRHIEALESQKADLERELERKCDEVRQLQNGARRSMRGASVPKSPRMGTMSPGQARPTSMARVKSGQGSRSGSPAVGGGAGGGNGGSADPIRGTFASVQFGEALPGAAAAAAARRFGEHLT